MWGEVVPAVQLSAAGDQGVCPSISHSRCSDEKRGEPRGVAIVRGRECGGQDPDAFVHRAVMFLETLEEKDVRINGLLAEEKRVAAEAKKKRDATRRAALSQLGLL